MRLALWVTVLNPDRPLTLQRGLDSRLVVCYSLEPRPPSDPPKGFGFETSCVL